MKPLCSALPIARSISRHGKAGTLRCADSACRIDAAVALLSVHASGNASGINADTLTSSGGLQITAALDTTPAGGGSAQTDAGPLVEPGMEYGFHCARHSR